MDAATATVCVFLGGTDEHAMVLTRVYCQRCEREVMPHMDCGDASCPRCRLVL